MIYLKARIKSLLTQMSRRRSLHSELKVPYLSVLKPGSNTHRGSNIRRVVQQNERNKRLGSFKRRVPKLLNLINFKMVPNVKEISLFS